MEHFPSRQSLVTITAITHITMAGHLTKSECMLGLWCKVHRTTCASWASVHQNPRGPLGPSILYS
jgi:hypothetical protein